MRQPDSEIAQRIILMANDLLNAISYDYDIDTYIVQDADKMNDLDSLLTAYEVIAGAKFFSEEKDLEDIEEPEYTTQEEFIGLVRKERERQDAKWGKQKHSGHAWLSILVEEVGEVATAINDNDFSGTVEELVQVAAVCCSIYEHGMENRDNFLPSWGEYGDETSASTVGGLHWDGCTICSKDRLTCGAILIVDYRAKRVTCPYFEQRN